MSHEPVSDVRTFVRDRYADIADQFQPSVVSSGCCGSDASQGQAKEVCDCTATQLYQAADLAELPAEVTELSLGCGDPVTLAALQEGQTVLDLGAGGGIDCFLAARRVGSTGRVIGVDMTPSMLDRARANQARLGLENVEFRLGEIEHLPVADGTVDVIISNCVINLSPDKAQVFRDAFRALRPGGKLAVSDIVTDGPLPPAIKNSLSAWAGCIAGALDAADYVAAIEAAGFVDVQLAPVYLEQAMVDEAAAQLGDVVELREIPAETLRKTVFSAKVTAFKPVT